MTVASLAAALHDLPHAPLCVGLSGGLDSSVLLHLLAARESVRSAGLRALHVHHGLQPQADQWAADCGERCQSLGVQLEVVRVTVDRTSGAGLEAAARRARHAAFAGSLAAGEVLALGHHRDDQAETFLLRALRSSGPGGLGAIRRWRDIGSGRLWRPLLDVPRAALNEYARARDLTWIEDPSNHDATFDRNFLRHHILPALRERWPHADAALARSAGLAAQADALLEEEDAHALAGCRLDRRTISSSGLQALPAARRARVLRRWTSELDLPPLPAAGVVRIESDLLGARADADATFSWAGARIRRWRDLLHASNDRAALPEEFETQWDGATPLQLPTGDCLALTPVGAACGDERIAKFASPVRVHARRGGERIGLPGRSHSHALKHVLQDIGIPPWRRERLPLVSTAEGELLAAGDLIRSNAFDDWLHRLGLQLEWTESDTLHLQGR